MSDFISQDINKTGLRGLATLLEGAGYLFFRVRQFFQKKIFFYGDKAVKLDNDLIVVQRSESTIVISRRNHINVPISVKKDTFKYNVV